MSLLTKKHGEVWISVGKGEQPVSRKVKSFKNREKAIQFVLEIEEYGGPEEVLPLLAEAMQPRWAQWWSTFQFTGDSSVSEWRNIPNCVLGPRQFAWIAAQIARAAVEAEPRNQMQKRIQFILLAEAWAIETDREALRQIQFLVRAKELSLEEPFLTYSANLAAADAARLVLYPHNAEIFVRTTEEAARWAIDAREDLAARMRSLITPTLVTSASRGLRASGGASSMVLPASVGVALGAGATLLSRRV